MTNPGSIASQVPAGDDFLVRRVQDLERIVREMQSSPTLTSASISSGGLSIIDGGSLRVLDQATGTAVLYMGEVSLNSVPADGRTQQMGFFVTRDDGTAILQMADLNSTPGHTHVQALQWFDRTGNVVIADDTNGGVGLARPYLAGAFQNMNTGSWPTTTSTSYGNLAQTYWVRQNPGISFSLYIHADSGTTGQFRLSVDGTVVATSPTVTNAFAVWSGTYFWPAGWTLNSVAGLSIDGIVTAGAGTVSTQTLLLSGAQSP